MPEKEKTELAGETPAVDIPDLKKKEEEERKGGGVLWRSPKAGGPGFGAGGGNAAGGARAAASSAARWAAAQAAGASGRGFGALLSGLVSTLLGKVFLAAAVSLVLGGAAVVLKKMNAGAGAAGPNLGGVSSSLSVRRGGLDRMLAYGKGLFSGQAASSGQQGQPVAGKNEASPGASQQAAVPPVPDIGAAIAEANRRAGGAGDRLPHDLSGAKLSSQLGGSSALQGSPSGLSGVIAGDAGVLGSGLEGGGKGVLSRMPAGGARAVSSGRRSVQGIRSKRAIGQLKAMRDITSGLAGATQEGARTMAADAFDGGRTVGGVLNASPPASVGGTAVGGGSAGSAGAGGAGGAAGSNGFGGTVPADLKGTNVDDIVSKTDDQPAGKDVTNWAGPVETALDMAQKAYEKDQQSIYLIAAGGAMAAVGIGLLATGVSSIAGAALLAAAAATIATGVNLRLEAQRMTEDARKLSSQIKEQYGQEYQKKIIDECLDQALKGTKPSECDPATKPNPKSNVSESVQKERDATYHLQENQNGEPIQ